MADFVLGQSASLSKTISEADIYAYAGISGDFNPLYVDANIPREPGLGNGLHTGC